MPSVSFKQYFIRGGRKSISKNSNVFYFNNTYYILCLKGSVNEKKLMFEIKFLKKKNNPSGIVAEVWKNCQLENLYKYFFLDTKNNADK